MKEEDERDEERLRDEAAREDVKRDERTAKGNGYAPGAEAADSVRHLPGIRAGSWIMPRT